MKKVVLVIVPLLLVSFVLAGPKGPQGPKGDGPLPAPENLTATVDGTIITCTWTAVPGATKYSLEACLVGVASDGTTEFPIKVKACVSVPQPEPTDPPTTTVAGALDIAQAIEDALVAAGADPKAILSISLEGMVHVKAMNPGKKAGPQNHPWSESVAITYEWPEEVD